MTDAAQKRAESLHYQREIARRIDAILAVHGERPGPLAKLYCSCFVGMARTLGRTRDEATKLLHEMWERFERVEREQLRDVAADVKSGPSS